MPAPSPLELIVPRNGTAVLQHLQRLVGREGHRRWCGGSIAVHKVPRFLDKMANRYPLLRNTRERSYDRHRGRAVVHLVMCSPLGIDAHGPASALLWWLLSDEGAGGLADPVSPDAHVCCDAMSAVGHITVHDYVLLYATKRVPHSIPDRRTGKPRQIWTDTSTWTWKLQGSVISEIRASIEACCSALQFGAEATPDRAGWGLNGLLAAQRSRPLFSGVRNQVIDLHMYARDTWARYRPAWVNAHPQLASKLGRDAGALRSVEDVISYDLPTMRQLRIYDAPPRSIRDLLSVPLIVPARS